jgi:glutamyl-tRNA reductase
MVGLSHRDVPLDVLEHVVIRRDDLPQAIEDVHAAGFAEAVVVSTCSRTEIYTTAGADREDDLVELLERRAGLARAAVRPAAQVLTGRQLVAHLFRVTAGLDSRVVGEVDVHGQVRAAFRVARAAGMTGHMLGRLFPAALRCSLEVRARTGLDAHGQSLARTAVDVGLRHATAADRCTPRVLVVGSGQMATTATEHLNSLGIVCRVAARDESYAARLVGRGLVRPLSSLVEEIGKSDLLICATSALHHVVTDEHVRRAMARRAQDLTIVDLAVPRNVDGAVAGIDGVRLIDLTGLNDEATTDDALRAAVKMGAAVVEAAAQAFVTDVAARDAGPMIEALRRRVEDTCLTQLSGVAAPGTSPDELVRAAHMVAGKLVHPPTIAARRAAADGDTQTLLLLCELFGVGPAEAGLTPSS